MQNPEPDAIPEKGNSMNIKTLEFIHKLLKEKKEATQEAYKNAREILDKLEEQENKDFGMIDAQTEQKERKWQERTEAENALEDFENHEWQ